MSEFWKAFRSPQEKLDDEKRDLLMDRIDDGEPLCRDCAEVELIASTLCGCPHCNPDGERFCPRCNKYEACGKRRR